MVKCMHIGLALMLSAASLLVLASTGPGLVHGEQTAQQRQALSRLQNPRLKGNPKTFEQILELLEAARGGSGGSGDDNTAGNQIQESSKVGDAVEPSPSIGGQDGKRVSVAQLIELSHFDLNKCTEDSFRRLVDWRKQLQHLALASYIREVIKRQRRFCEQYLDEQVELRLTTMSLPTKQYFEVFLEYDKIGHDFYVAPESSVLKLREILAAGVPEILHDQKKPIQLEQGQFLRSCREITSQLGELVPIRKDHDIFARLPMSCDRYFRAYEFCHQLVDLNFSEELNKSLFLDVKSRSEISRFGVHLARQTRADSATDPHHQANTPIDRSKVLYAARDFVQERAPNPIGRQVTAMALANQQSNLILAKLKAACASSLDLTENLRWLRDVMMMESSMVRTIDVTPRALEYLRSLEGCKHLLELEVVEVLVQPRQTPRKRSATGGNTKVKQPFGVKIMNIFKFKRPQVTTN